MKKNRTNLVLSFGAARLLVADSLRRFCRVFVSVLVFAALGFRLAEASDPQLVGQWVGEFVLRGDVVDVAVAGRYAYLANRVRGLQIIDVADPAAPVFVSEFNTSWDPAANPRGEAYEVVVVGNLVYAAADHGFQIIDVSDPAAPRRVGGLLTGADTSGIAVVGNLAFATSRFTGLHVIDVSNPAAPVEVGNFDMWKQLAPICPICTTEGPVDVAVSGSLVYVAHMTSFGLLVIDVSDPTSPTHVGGYNTSGYAGNVAVSGNFAYVSDWGTGLQVIDVSNPSMPLRAGGFETFPYPSRVEIAGKYAFVSYGTDGLQVVDVSDPAAPVSVGGYDSDGSAGGIAIRGNLAYVAGGTSGLLILQLVPEGPKLEIARVGEQIILSWPAFEGNFRLESTDALAPEASWSELSGAELVDDQLRVTTRVNETKAFYRLRKAQ